jgi:hypothetical protein
VRAILDLIKLVRDAGILLDSLMLLVGIASGLIAYRGFMKLSRDQHDPCSYMDAKKKFADQENLLTRSLWGSTVFAGYFLLRVVIGLLRAL